MVRLGRLSFKANDRSDLFAVLNVEEAGFEQSDEVFSGIDDPHFESSSAFLDGRVPKMKTVNIDGDTTIIKAWYCGEKDFGTFFVRIYVEYEEVEEMICNELEIDPEDKDDPLAQKEVFL